LKKERGGSRTVLTARKNAGIRKTAKKREKEREREE